MVPDCRNGMKLAESGCGAQDIPPPPKKMTFRKTAFRERKWKQPPMVLPRFHVLKPVEKVSIRSNRNTGEL